MIGALLLAQLTLTQQPGVAARFSITTHAPDTVAACDAIDVSVAVRGYGRAMPRLVAPDLAPFDLLRGTFAPRVSYSGSSFVAEYRFTITTDRSGTFTLPPFEVRGSDPQERAVSPPTVIAVLPTRTFGVPVVVARARIDTSSSMSLRAVAIPETVFVGQQATYEVAVFLNQMARQRLRRNPTFYPPEMQAMLAYDLPAPAAAGISTTPRRDRGGPQCFDALVYRRALFPLIAGRLVIPPAQLVYSLGLSPLSYNNREESHELQTDSVAIVAIDPPAASRPPEYTGAVGDIRLDARLDSLTARVGDPMLLTLRITGIGNVKLFPRPPVAIPWAGLVAADERVRIDSSNAKIGGVKEFDWVLTPRIAGEFDVPPVRYGYFDPMRRQYGVAATDAARVRVGAGTLATADTGHAESALPIRVRYMGESWPPLQSRPIFWLAMALAPLPALGARARRRVVRPPPAPVHDPLRALEAAATDDPVTTRRHFVRALAQRLGCNPEDFTHPGALERALLRAGVSPETSQRAEALLRALDTAAYAGPDAVSPHTIRDAAAIARAVDAQALRRAELPFWIPMLVAATSLTVVSVAIAADPASVHFARGVSSYVRQQYPVARDAFASAATLAPASADAWANFGTASWAVGDTAAAVLGWRQALAIEPTASDVLARMALVRDVGPTAPGWVPPLPRNATVWLFGILWICAWSIAWLARQARTASRYPAWLARMPLPVGVCALVVGLLSIEIEAGVSGARLAIVRRAAPLVSDPAIGMDRGPNVGTGEIVRVAGRRGIWTRIEASDERDGWIASSELFMLADRRPPRD